MPYRKSSSGLYLPSRMVRQREQQQQAATQQVMLAQRIVAAGGNWWEAGGATGCVLAYQPKGAASYAASKVNLANPGTYDAADITAPTWSSGNGWEFLAANSTCLLSGYVPVAGCTTLVQFTGYSQSGSQLLFGCFDNGLTSSHLIGWGSYYANGAYQSISAIGTSGNECVAGPDAYRDGVDIGNLTGSYTSPVMLVIGAGRNGGDQDGYFCTVNIQALSHYSGTLNATKVAAVAAAMGAL